LTVSIALYQNYIPRKFWPDAYGHHGWIIVLALPACKQPGLYEHALVSLLVRSVQGKGLIRRRGFD